MFCSPAHIHHWCTQLGGRAFRLTPGSSHSSKQSGTNILRRTCHTDESIYPRLSVLLSTCNYRDTQFATFLCVKWNKIALLQSCIPTLFFWFIHFVDWHFPLNLLWLVLSRNKGITGALGWLLCSSRFDQRFAMKIQAVNSWIQGWTMGDIYVECSWQMAYQLLKVPSAFLLR